MQETFTTKPSPKIEDSKVEKIKEKWHKKWWGVLLLAFGAALVIFFLIFLGMVFYYYRQIKSGKLPIPASAKFIRSTTPAVTPKQLDPQRIYPDGEPSSASGAPLTIVGFFDFQCPFSKETSSTIREMQAIYKDRVNFVFRNFPLIEIHPEAMLAAQAGECAHLQNKFWQMHDKLFLSQNFTETNLKLYAQEIGLDETKFAECLSSSQSKGQVLKDLMDGELLGVRGTPTWFINNQKIEGAISKDAFKKIIDFLLAGQK